MTTAVSVHNSSVKYPDVTALDCLPDSVLKIIFDYDSFFSINRILSNMCPRWAQCEMELAGRKWKELKKSCRAEYPRLLQRMNKIERRFKDEGVFSWFDRLDKRTERAGRLHQIDLTTLKPEGEAQIVFDTLMKMEEAVLEQRDIHLTRVWNASLYQAADDLTAMEWTADQIRSWITAQGTINHPNLGFQFLRLHSLKGLPSELSQFVSINWLEVDRNQITFLPSKIGEMTSLCRLDVRDNPLQRLPKKMDKLFNNEDFKLILDREQFLRLHDQIIQIYPAAPWYHKLFNSIILFCISLYYFVDQIIHCGFKKKPLEFSTYTKEEIAAFNPQEVKAIHLCSHNFFSPTWETFFSERKFTVLFNSDDDIYIGLA